MKKALLALIVVLAIVVAFPLAARASEITFTGTNGSNLSASATFSAAAGTLTVILTNTSAFDVLDPSQVLTALFFNLSSPTLTPVSALLNASTVFFGPDGSGNVGGEWAYGSGLTGAPGAATQGISSSGFGLFGAANFNGANLQGPVAVNGVNYGLLSAGDNTSTGNAAVTGQFPLIQNSVVFTLSYSGDLDLNDISNVSFQYGTSLSDFNTPDGGATITLLGLALAGIGLVSRRRK